MTDRDYSHRLLIDKLGVKPMSKVSVLGVEDREFWKQLQARTPDVSRKPRKNSDTIFYSADSEPALKRLSSLKMYIRSGGAIWVVSLKGKQAKIKDVQVIAAAKAAGLVDNKVASFSETHTALRLVIPRALR